MYYIPEYSVTLFALYTCVSEKGKEKMFFYLYSHYSLQPEGQVWWQQIFSSFFIFF